MRTVIAVLAALAAALAVVPASLAKGDDDVIVRGACTKSSTAKLKLSDEDGRLEVEFEVDQNRNGVRWNVSLKRGATVVASTQATTRGPSGSFEVRRVIGAGALVTARATSPSGEVCSLKARK